MRRNAEWRGWLHASISMGLRNVHSFVCSHSFIELKQYFDRRHKRIYFMYQWYMNAIGTLQTVTGSFRCTVDSSLADQSKSSLVAPGQRAICPTTIAHESYRLPTGKNTGFCVKFRSIWLLFCSRNSITHSNFLVITTALGSWLVT